MCLGEVPRTGCGYARKALGFTAEYAEHAEGGVVVEGSCFGWGLAVDVVWGVCGSGWQMLLI